MDFFICMIVILIGSRVLEIIDSLIELFKHFLATKMQRYEVTIRQIASEIDEEPCGQAMPQIGFDLTPDIEEDEELDD